MASTSAAVKRSTSPVGKLGVPGPALRESSNAQEGEHDVLHLTLAVAWWAEEYHSFGRAVLA